MIGGILSISVRALQLECSLAAQKPDPFSDVRGFHLRQFNSCSSIYSAKAIESILPGTTSMSWGRVKFCKLNLSMCAYEYYLQSTAW